MQGNDLVQEARHRAALTQSELAARLGVPQSTIARWETARIAPSYENVVRVIRACGLELAVQVVEPDEQLRELIEEHLRMSPAERFAQNTYLVNFVDGARRRIGAARA